MGIAVIDYGIKSRSDCIFNGQLNESLWTQCNRSNYSQTNKYPKRQRTDIFFVFASFAS